MQCRIPRDIRNEAVKFENVSRPGFNMNISVVGQPNVNSVFYVQKNRKVYFQAEIGNFEGASHWRSAIVDLENPENTKIGINDKGKSIVASSGFEWFEGNGAYADNRPSIRIPFSRNFSLTFNRTNCEILGRRSIMRHLGLIIVSENPIGEMFSSNFFRFKINCRPTRNYDKQ